MNHDLVTFKKKWKEKNNPKWIKGYYFHDYFWLSFCLSSPKLALLWI